MLKREREHDGGISRIRVRLISGFVVTQKEFADLPVIKAAHRRGEAKPSEFENKRLIVPSNWKPPSGGLWRLHDAAPSHAHSRNKLTLPAAALHGRRGRGRGHENLYAVRASGWPVIHASI
ncbi:MAG: hypothetical protein ACLP19_24030 [Xanthobacteraceae bacterium]